MQKSSYEFEVLVNGHSAKEYYQDGKTYLEGKEGSRFSLRMRNNSSSRVLFVPTVDGLSILNGKEGSFKSRGYIVGAYDSTTIDGWRTSDDKVAEFFFSSPKGSYAKKMGKGGNLGIIGCAVFKEKHKEKEIVYAPIIIQNPNNNPWWGSTYTTIASNCSGSFPLSMQNASLNSVKAFSCANAGSDLGTGFGQDKYSPTTSVDFDRADSPTEIFSFYYNTRQNLEAMGVEFHKPVYVSPSAFPNEDGYCERPY